MLKIFPIIIIPLFFIIIFLGVKNLTQNNPNISEVVEEKIEKGKEKIIKHLKIGGNEYKTLAIKPTTVPKPNKSRIGRRYAKVGTV